MSETTDNAAETVDFTFELGEREVSFDIDEELYALDAVLNFSSDAGKAGLERAMKEHIIGQAQIVGLYKRK